MGELLIHFLHPHGAYVLMIWLCRQSNKWRGIFLSIGSARLAFSNSLLTRNYKHTSMPTNLVRGTCSPNYKNVSSIPVSLKRKVLVPPRTTTPIIWPVIARVRKGFSVPMKNAMTKRKHYSRSGNTLSDIILFTSHVAKYVVSVALR